MTSKSVLIEPEETQFQNEMLFKKRLTKCSSNLYEVISQ